jgi:hypothetical protein
MNLIKPAYAQICNPALPLLGCGGATKGGDLLGGLIGGAVAMLLIVGTIAAFIFLILGALRWILSSGDKAKLQQAQETITNAILGLILLASAWAIIALVGNFLGLGVIGNGFSGWRLDLPTL